MNTRLATRFGIGAMCFLASWAMSTTAADAAPQRSTGGIQGGINIDNPSLPGLMPSSRLPSRPTGLARPSRLIRTGQPAQIQPRNTATPATLPRSASSQPPTGRPAGSGQPLAQPVNKLSKSEPAGRLTTTPEPELLPVKLLKTPTRLPAPRQPMQLRQVSLKEQLKRTAKAAKLTPKKTGTATTETRMLQQTKTKMRDARKSQAKDTMNQVKADAMGEGSDAKMQPKDSAKGDANAKQPRDLSNLEGPTAEEVELQFQNGQLLLPPSSELILESNGQLSVSPLLNSPTGIGSTDYGAANYATANYAPSLGHVASRGPWDSYLAQYMPSLSQSISYSCAPSVYEVQFQSRGCLGRRSITEYRKVECGQVWVRRVERIGLLGLRRRTSYYSLSPAAEVYLQDCCEQNITPAFTSSISTMQPLLNSPIISDTPMAELNSGQFFEMPVQSIVEEPMATQGVPSFEFTDGETAAATEEPKAMGAETEKAMDAEKTMDNSKMDSKKQPAKTPMKTPAPETMKKPESLPQPGSDASSPKSAAAMELEKLNETLRKLEEAEKREAELLKKRK